MHYPFDCYYGLYIQHYLYAKKNTSIFLEHINATMVGSTVLNQMTYSKENCIYFPHLVQLTHLGFT